MNLHNLKIYKEVSTSEMLSKLNEEVFEVKVELYRNRISKDHLAEELLDVIQTCLGIAYTQNIDLNNYISTHYSKLLSRGHKFID